MGIVLMIFLTLFAFVQGCKEDSPPAKEEQFNSYINANPQNQEKAETNSLVNVAF